MLWNRALGDAPTVPCLCFLAAHSTDSTGEVFLFCAGRLEKEQVDDIRDLTGKGKTRKRTVSHISANSAPERH